MLGWEQPSVDFLVKILTKCQYETPYWGRLMSWGHLVDTWRTTLIENLLCPGDTWRTLGGRPHYIKKTEVETSSMVRLTLVQI